MTDKRIKFVRRVDRAATGIIRVGGIGVVISVIAILVLIAKEALPLFFEPTQTSTQISIAAKPGPLQIVIPGNYPDQFLKIRTDGKYEVHHLHGAVETNNLPGISPSTSLSGLDWAGFESFSVRLDNETFAIYEAVQRLTFSGTNRQVRFEVNQLASFQFSNASANARFSLRAAESRSVAALSSDGSRVDVRLVMKKKNFLGKITETTAAHTIDPQLQDETISVLCLDQTGDRLFVGTSRGYVMGWQLEAKGPVLLDRVEDGNSTVTALQLALGNETVVAGHADGTLAAWTMVQTPGSGRGLIKLYTLPKHDQAIQQIIPSPTYRAIISLDAGGTARMSHITSARTLYEFSEHGPVNSVWLSGRGNQLGVLGTDGRQFLVELKNPHPETSVHTLFGKVWYEGYPEPGFTWQSSSASDDFEPKLSLIPLIFGSLKGTLYAMLFSVPLALFAAIYVSQFTTPGIRQVIKPTVEVMAAIPSVVIGFLAALWFAPLVESNLAGFFLAAGVLPVTLLICILVWQPIRRSRWLEPLGKGLEFAALIPPIVISILVAFWVGRMLESSLFEGNLQQWMFNKSGIIYDQRNCIVIAFALGFAVIPIIFTIAEDAFSNVPAGLRAASLALGASRWQTVWRVILPSASPGIFAAIVIGLGRAVGETMIVLMATGNTPIIDWSAFNGMRTLSANIAVEIPEAPVGGTLYRVLFLSAVILFSITFVLNTAAELVRQNLRKKFGQFQ